MRCRIRRAAFRFDSFVLSEAGFEIDIPGKRHIEIPNTVSSAADIGPPGVFVSLLPRSDVMDSAARDLEVSLLCSYSSGVLIVVLAGTPYLSAIKINPFDRVEDKEVRAIPLRFQFHPTVNHTIAVRSAELIVRVLRDVIAECLSPEPYPTVVLIRVRPVASLQSGHCLCERHIRFRVGRGDVADDGFGHVPHAVCNLRKQGSHWTRHQSEAETGKDRPAAEGNPLALLCLFDFIVLSHGTPFPCDVFQVSFT